MRKSYIFVYSDKLGSREEVKQLINKIPEIIHWRYDLPNCFYIVSEESAKTLSSLIMNKGKGKSARFVINEFNESVEYEGILTVDSWYLIQNKKYKPK